MGFLNKEDGKALHSNIGTMGRFMLRSINLNGICKIELSKASNRKQSQLINAKT